MADISRRTLIAAAVGAAASAALVPAQAQQMQRCAPIAPAGTKGPRVFLDYDQAELDASYDQSPWAPNQPQVSARVAANCDLMRKRIGEPRREAYGPTDVEKLDIYRTTRANAPIMVFIHGGAWRSGTAKASALPAEMFTRSGAHYVALDFAGIE